MIVKWIEQLESMLPRGRDLIYKTEAPCSRYYIDLVVRGKYNDYLYEFKTRFEDIGKVLRQLRRYEDSWTKEEQRRPPQTDETFHYVNSVTVLIALDTDVNRKHLKAYGKLFKDFRVGLYNLEKNEIYVLSGKKSDLFPIFEEKEEKGDWIL